MKPLVIDLFCGLGGWTKGFLTEGYRAVGFDIERREYPGSLVLQDVLTLDGAQLKDAAAIVASPPCQKYSYMAQPWTRAKKEAVWQRWERDSPFGDFRLNALFNACFRIQHEASLAAGHCIPMVVENVKGAQPWVGSAKWHYGSFYLWGDVPALMPLPVEGLKTVGHANMRDGHSHTRHLTNQRESDAVKGNGKTWFGESHGQTFEGQPGNPARGDGVKVPGISWSGYGTPGYKAQGFNVQAAQRYRAERGGTKVSGDWFGSYADQKAAGTISPGRLHGNRSDSRKAASAAIAEIPYDLSNWIARCFKPVGETPQQTVASARQF